MGIYRTYTEYCKLIEGGGFTIEYEDVVDHQDDTRHHLFLCRKTSASEPRT
jgi:hypothetical protein